MPQLLINAYIAVISGVFLWATVNMCHTRGHPAAVRYFSADQMTLTSEYWCFLLLVTGRPSTAPSMFVCW